MKRVREQGRRRCAAAVVLIAVAGSLCLAQEPAPPDAPATAASGVVTANVLVVRARPAAHYERIGQFARGDVLTIVGETADWLQVRVPADTRAWIAAQYLDPQGVVGADQVRLHSGPGLVFTTFATIPKGTRLDVLGPPVDGWQQVRAPAESSAWVSRAYVRIETPEPPTAADPATEPATDPATAPAANTDGNSTADTATPTTTTNSTPGATTDTAATTDDNNNASQADTTGTTTTGTTTTGTTTTGTTTTGTTTTGTTTTGTAETAPTGTADAADTTDTTAVGAATPQTTSVATSADTPTAEAATNADTTTVASAATTEASASATTDTTTVPPTPDAATTATADATADAAAVQPVEWPTAPAPDAPLVMREGILLTLGGQATEIASHVLSMPIEQTAYPVCYLKSRRIDLTAWENRNVCVYGRELQIPGWQRLVMHVESIQVKLP